MTSLVFPDINIWIALTVQSHEHNRVAWQWCDSLHAQQKLVFCRLTQLGLLRLLTNENVTKPDKLNQQEAWRMYDRWIEEGGGVFWQEPANLDVRFRRLTERTGGSSKEWADAYLTAFAAAADITLVTFDKALSKRSTHALLLTTALS